MITSPLVVKRNTLATRVITWMSQGRVADLSLSEPDFSELNLPSQEPSSCALVVENQQLLGIFTERDVVRLIGSGIDLSRTEISQVMTQPAIALAISATENTLTALSLMRQHRIRHLPVVNEQGLVGLVTQEQIYQAIAPAQMVRLRQVEEELEENRQREIAFGLRQDRWAQLLFENALDAIAITDDAGRYVDVNPAACALFGLSREEILRSKVADFADPDLNFAQMWQQFLQQGQMSGEWHLHRQDGTVREIEFAAVANFIPHHHLSILRDITERKQIEGEREQTQNLLQEREQMYRALVENSPDIIERFDVQLRHLYVSYALEALIGIPAQQFVGKTCREMGMPESMVNLWETAARALLATRQTQTIEFESPTTGGMRWFEMRIAPELTKAGTIESILCISRDISDRKAAEAALQESEQKFRAIFDSTFQFIGLLSTEGIVLEANRTALDAIAANPADIIGQPFWQTPWWTHSPQLQEQLQQAIVSAASGELVRFEAEHLLADGTSVFVDFSLKPVFDLEGKVVMLIPEGRDISDRKLAEQKIAEQAALIDIATDAINVRDLDNRVIFWSQGAERLYGFSAAEAVGKKISELVYQDFSSEFEVAVNETLEKGSWQGELEKVSKAGQKIIVASRWTLVRDRSGQPKSILVVSSDITEKKQLERQFYRAQRLESLGTLASGIAHDLNNVFTPILMISQLLPLKFNDIDRQTQEFFNTLEDTTKRGVDLVKQILTFARGTEGKHIVLQVGHLLKEVAKIAQQTFPKSIKIVAEISTNTLWSVKADPTQLHQVLMNIAVNARDAMPDGGMLSISAENRFIDRTYAEMNLDAHEGNYIVITIADTGIGIPPEIIDRIFDPFFTTKEVGKGTGLGLSTVLGIVKNHGGFLQVLSALGKGTEFQVYLPAVNATTTEVTKDTELFSGNGELILIVDDESTVRQITKASLEEHNYKTLVASDGIEAIALYAQHSKEICVVLIDMMMPNLDGLNAIRTMKALNSEVKIIASSGLSNNRQQLMALGAKAFLLKPYTAQELLQTLYHLLIANS